MRRAGTSGLGLALIACLVLPSGAVLAQQPTVRSDGGMTEGTFDVSGVSLSVDEGRMVVPANRGTQPSGTLTLRFVRFRSTADVPGAPIVFLAGGPGDAGTRVLRGIPLGYLRELRQIADVIAFDQRGTGGSEPLNPYCPPGEDLPRDRPADPRLILESLERRVASCLEVAARQGVDVKGLTTEESADDLEALRQVLGAERLTLLAGSYGTHLALAFARRHRTSVDRMALLGVEGPDDTFKLPSRIDEVMARVAEAKRPSLLDETLVLRARLAQEPTRFTFPTGQVISLGEWDLQRFIAESLGTIRQIDAMVGAIPGMLEGDFTALARWAVGYRSPKPLSLMNLAMDCASYASPERLARIRLEAEAALLGNAMDFPLPELCDVPGLPRLPASFRAPLASDVPALLVSGTLDGRTPVRNAADLARALPNGRLLTVDGASHGLFGEERVMREVVDFLRGEGASR